MTVMRSFATGAFWSMIGTASVQLSSFIVFVLLARLLSPVEFGIVAFAGIFIDVTRQMLAGGVADALVRRTGLDEETFVSAICLNNGLALAIGLALLACGVPLFSLIGHSESISILAVLAASLPIDATRAILEARLRRDLAFRSLMLRNVTASVAGGVAGVAVALAGGGAWALVVNRLVTNGLSLIMTWTLVRWVPRVGPSRQRMGELLRFSSSLFGTQLLSPLNAEIAPLIIGVAFGPAALALYRAGTRLTGFLGQLVFSPLYGVSLPIFSKLKDDPQALRDTFLRVSALSCIVAFPIVLGAGALASDFIALLLGPRWGDSSLIMTIAALMVAVTVIDYFFVPILTAAGKPGATLAYALTVAVANAAFALLAWPFGLIATVASQTIRAYATLPVVLGILRTHTGLAPRAVIANIAAPFVAAMLMAAAVMLLRQFVVPHWSAMAALAGLVPAGAAIYGLVLGTVFRDTLRQQLREAAALLPGSNRVDAPPDV